jgi:hypothetical protein
LLGPFFSNVRARITLDRWLAKRLSAAPAISPVAKNSVARRTQKQPRLWQQLSRSQAANRQSYHVAEQPNN